MRSKEINGFTSIEGPGSIRLCPGQSPTDVDGSLSTVMKAHWASITAFIHMAGRNRDQDLFFLCDSGLSNNLSLNASLKNSVTPAYPFSGCFFMYSSTSSYSSSGILKVLYFDTVPLCVKYNINNMCYRYVTNNITFINDCCVTGNIWLQKEVTA